MCSTCAGAKATRAPPRKCASTLEIVSRLRSQSRQFVWTIRLATSRRDTDEPSRYNRRVAAGESALRRDLGLWLGVLVVVNATIGTGIFKTPAKVARLAG